MLNNSSCGWTGRWFATPLFIVLLMVEVTDVVFALDSIPSCSGRNHGPVYCIYLKCLCDFGTAFAVFCVVWTHGTVPLPCVMVLAVVAGLYRYQNVASRGLAHPGVHSPRRCGRGAPPVGARLSHLSCSSRKHPYKARFSTESVVIIFPSVAVKRSEGVPDATCDGWGLETVCSSMEYGLVTFLLAYVGSRRIIQGDTCSGHVGHGLPRNQDGFYIRQEKVTRPYSYYCIPSQAPIHRTSRLAHPLIVSRATEGENDLLRFPC